MDGRRPGQFRKAPRTTEPGVQPDSSVVPPLTWDFDLTGRPPVRTLSAAGSAPSTESTAIPVRSSESGQRCEYVSRVSAAEA